MRTSRSCSADVLVTPAVDGLLPGVCRAALLDVAAALGLPVEQRAVALDELFAAQAVSSRRRRAGSARRSSSTAASCRASSPELLTLLRDGVAAEARAHALALP